MTPAQIEFIKAHPFAFTNLAAPYEAAIAKRIQKAVAAEFRSPERVGHVSKGSQKNYPEIVKLFPGHDPLAIAQVAAAIGESITTTENRLSSLVVRGYLRVEHIMHEGRRVKGHVRADAPVKPAAQEQPCNPYIMAKMQDGRERTAADIALSLGVTTKTLSKDLARLCRDGHLVTDTVRSGSGPKIRTYKTP